MPPRILVSPADMRVASDGWRRDGRRISFVPTMGYLHAGHVALLDEARRHGDIAVLSIFVNPTQFGPKEDLARYPRDLDGDLAKAAGAGIDYAFVPTAEAMYPAGYQTYVDVRALSSGLCGASRPGHFTGVATVVAKLFGLVQPHVAFFGRKDFQQLRVIERMTADLHLGVEVVGCPIVREPDGLAMSSRNAYLSPDDRAQAPALQAALRLAADAHRDGERSVEALLARATQHLATTPFQLDYLELRRRDDLTLFAVTVDGPAVLALAAFIGPPTRRTRLIDNLELG